MLFNRKMDYLIRMKILVHQGVKIAVNFTPSDLDHVTTTVDHIIQLSSSNPHFI